MPTSDLRIFTHQGQHLVRFTGPFTEQEMLEAARVLGHLNVALSGWPWSPCRWLKVINWRGGQR